MPGACTVLWHGPDVSHYHDAAATVPDEPNFLVRLGAQAGQLMAEASVRRRDCDQLRLYHSIRQPTIRHSISLKFPIPPRPPPPLTPRALSDERASRQPNLIQPVTSHHSTLLFSPFFLFLVSRGPLYILYVPLHSFLTASDPTALALLLNSTNSRVFFHGEIIQDGHGPH